MTKNNLRWEPEPEPKRFKKPRAEGVHKPGAVPKKAPKHCFKWSVLYKKTTVDAGYTLYSSANP